MYKTSVIDIEVVKLSNNPFFGACMVKLGSTCVVKLIREHSAICT